MKAWRFLGTLGSGLGVFSMAVALFFPPILILLLPAVLLLLVAYALLYVERKRKVFLLPLLGVILLVLVSVLSLSLIQIPSGTEILSPEAYTKLMFQVVFVATVLYLFCLLNSVLVALADWNVGTSIFKVSAVIEVISGLIFCLLAPVSWFVRFLAFVTYEEERGSPGGGGQPSGSQGTV